MFPLWEKVIAPTLEASGARRVVEIGALRGETTVKLLDRLGPESELHVIDPVPQFDPSEHEQAFPGRYHFHREISLNALPTLPPMDAALIDGDHNWFTVHSELELLAAAAREAGAPLPLLFMHDVGWPYGRRDLYYAPERIPEEFRQPYGKAGLRRARAEAVEGDGINAQMNNALLEGGPRNGVMTALDDFAAEHDRELRVAVLPIYFSLAVVAEEERIAARPELAQAFERFRRPAFLREMLKLAEGLRIRQLQWGQSIFYTAQGKLERAAGRYLDLLAADLGERLVHLDRLQDCLETIRGERVAGDLMQCGDAAGDAAVYMRAFVAAHELRFRDVWLVGDTAGSEPPSSRFARLALLDEHVQVVDQSSIATLAEMPIERLALLELGAGSAAGEVLEQVYDRITLGGFIIVDDYSDPACREAVDAFRATRGVEDALELAEPGGAWWRKVR